MSQIGGCTPCASSENLTSILALRKALDSQKLMAEQLLPPPPADDTAQLSDAAQQLYQEQAPPAAAVDAVAQSASPTDAVSGSTFSALV